MDDDLIPQRWHFPDYELGVELPPCWKEITSERCNCRVFEAHQGCLVFIDHPVSMLRITPGQPRFAYVLEANADLMFFTDCWTELLHSIRQFARAATAIPEQRDSYRGQSAQSY